MVALILPSAVIAVLGWRNMITMITDDHINPFIWP